MTTQMSALLRNAFLLSALTIAAILTALFAIPTFASAAAISQQLDLDESNADVTSLQTFLRDETSFYPGGLVTGYFGPMTAAAVSRFQTANGLAAVGRVGPMTRDLINTQMGGGGNPNPTGDISAPIIYPETVSTTPSTATISWTTSEAAKNRVMYGSTWPFLYSTAPSVTADGYSATANLTITGLQSRSTYYYTLESIDNSGNVMWTVGKPMVTQ